MGMDVEPIYCAEQIVVPPDLAEVLKAYTKEVIRRQPKNLVEFSAKYFANLANVAGAAQDFPAPTREQLRQVHSRAGSDSTLSDAQVEALCQQAGVADAVVAKVLQAGKFDPNKVDVLRFTFLLLAMTCDNFSGLLSGMFDVFGQGGSIPSTQFVTMVGFLAPDMDPAITPDLLEELAAAMPGKSVTYAQACALKPLQAKLGL